MEALLARDAHQAKQVEVLRAELARERRGNTTGHLSAALHDEALQEVRADCVCVRWACLPQHILLATVVA